MKIIRLAPDVIQVDNQIWKKTKQRTRKDQKCIKCGRFIPRMSEKMYAPQRKVDKHVRLCVPCANDDFLGYIQIEL